MNEASVEMILSSVDKLFVKFGMTAEQMWPYLVRQQYVNFLISVVFSIAVGGGLYKLVRFVTSHWNPSEDIYSIYSSDHEVLYVMTICVLAVIETVLLISFGINIMYVFNPQYGALHDLLYMIDGLK